MAPVKAAIYTRTAIFASASVAGQVEACQRYASRHGWNVVGQFSDTGSVVDVGHQMVKLVWAVERGEVDGVVMATLSRLTRRAQFDTHPLVKACLDRGIPIAFAKENAMVDADTDVLSARIMAAIGPRDKARIRRLRSERSKPRRCLCGYEARNEDDLDEHAIAMARLDDRQSHGEA